ncbi:uncharacterized protein LOC121808402 isoform X1 [Salvia splendens]|uniref:uncharacterized protein LOC121808402 isoform X1 n=1 Tax=Salvia splendens TaxID=180675 RepID=UPI001C25E018|nr:uncharacterized protein LOC121808402 isoform X1 [Salvia splendens]
MEGHILTVKVVSISSAKEGQAAMRRRRAMVRLDRQLEKGNCKAALSLMKQFKAHPAGFIRGFGAAAVPKVSGRVTSFDLAGRSKKSSLQLVIDAILQSLKRSLEFQLQEEEVEILPKDIRQITDAESCDSIYEDRQMCLQHEAGHFLVGYMLGVLPRRYKVPSIEDLLQDKLACGKVEFIGFEFLREVGIDPMSNRTFSKGKLNKETLKTFSCVILGGMAAEHLLFGYSELLHSDVEKFARVHRWLGFTVDEVDFAHRQAAEATVLLLSSQMEALSRLAEAMALGGSVGFCIETIEHTLSWNNKL